MNQLAAFLDFSRESDAFSLTSPLPQERVLERLAQCLNPDIMQGFLLPSYAGTGSLIGIREDNRFRLFLRPQLFYGFAGDFQGKVEQEGTSSRVIGNFREPQFSLIGFLQSGTRTIRNSSFGFVLFLALWCSCIGFWIVKGFHGEAALPAAFFLGLFPFVMAGHWFCVSSCRRGRLKILTELAMIAQSTDTPWMTYRPRKQP